MEIEFLGTGTSVGIPMIGCECATCTSDDPRDRRLRVSLLVRYRGAQILIDPAIDFRQQALRAGLKSLDAVLITHAHADHVFGIDDLRALNYRQGPMPCFASAETWRYLYRMFGYAFGPPGPSSRPRLIPHLIGGDFSLCGLHVTPVELPHGDMTTLGFRLNDFAYITDCSAIPDAACERLLGLDTLVLDCVRYTPHPTHLHLQAALDYIARLQPKRAYLTHMAHDIRHTDLEGRLPPGVCLAYDGLRIAVRQVISVGAACGSEVRAG